MKWTTLVCMSFAMAATALGQTSSMMDDDDATETTEATEVTEAAEATSAAENAAEATTTAAAAATGAAYACVSGTSPKNDTTAPGSIDDCRCNAGLFTKTNGKTCDGECPDRNVAGISYLFNRNASATVVSTAHIDCRLNITDTEPLFVNTSGLLEVCKPKAPFCGVKLVAPNKCEDDCSTCVAGHGNKNKDKCRECAKGFFGLEGTACVACPVHTAAGSSLIGFGDVSIRCTADVGYEFNADGVPECTKGYYGVDDCTACPAGYTAREIAAPGFGSLLERCVQEWEGAAVSTSVSAMLLFATAGIAALI